MNYTLPTWQVSDDFSLPLYDSLISELYFRESPKLLFILSLKIIIRKSQITYFFQIIIILVYLIIFLMHYNIIFTVWGKPFMRLAEIDLQKYYAH